VPVEEVEGYFPSLARARDRLYDEVQFYRCNPKPVGEFLSRLIIECPQELWLRIRDQIGIKWDGGED
jgi:hypothetical protein